MKMKAEKLFTLICMLILVMPASAQTGMEEYFYHSGKIKVVIGVVAIVLVGLIIYLWRLDNRVTRMEKEQKGGKS
jgi:membrane protein YdbS with pleckstrin-like domain